MVEKRLEQQAIPLPQQLITDVLEGRPEVLVGAFIIAQQIAGSNSVPLGINVTEPLKADLLSVMMPEVACALAQGDDITMESGQVARFVADGELEEFTGLVLFVGAEPNRLELLAGMQKATAFVVPNNEKELNALASAFPYSARAQLRPEPRTSNLSESQLKGGEWFDDRYELLSDGHFNPQSALVRLGVAEVRSCRYCGKAVPDVTFSNISHAFPEQIGNKKLVDARECDTCNAHFAAKVDDHFAKWSLPARTAGRIRGKRGVPSIQTTDEKFRMDYVTGILKISVQQDDPRFKSDDEAKSIELKLERQPYIPMAVFKCFIKMALAVMPEPEASQCQHLKSWILEPTHTYESFPYKPLILLSQIVPGPLPNDKVSYILLRRKSEAPGCPYLMFVVQYANYVHQIALPMPTQDVPDGVADFELQYFPHPWDTPEHITAFGRAQRHQEDLTSPDVKRGDVYPMRLSFDRKERVDSPEPT